MQLTGRTILITGGSRGIGLAFAERFMSLGNTVIVTGRNADTLAKVETSYPGLHTITCDVSNPAAIEALAQEVEERFPALDVLMNNAGIMYTRNLTHGTDDLVGLTSEIDVNFSGTVRMVAALIDRLVAHKGTLINVSSGLAYVPLQAMPIYCATKAALHSYTVTMRQQLRGKVDVIEIAPPATKTEMTQGLDEGGAFAMLTVDQLIEQSFKGLRSGAEEIRPGQSSSLYWMSRIAPGFIQGQLEKGGADLVPKD